MIVVAEIPLKKRDRLEINEFDNCESSILKNELLKIYRDINNIYYSGGNELLHGDEWLLSL